MKLFLIGMVSGIVTGLGTGGGSILILILTMLFNVEQRTAQAANLLFFIFTSFSAIFIYFKEKNVEAEIGKKLLYATILGSGLGAYLTLQIDVGSLKKYFGIFLLLVAMTDITINFKKKMNEKKGEHKK